MDPRMRLVAMVEELKKAPPEVRPSEFWIELNTKNEQQLETFGYENFKRTVALNYFTWMVLPTDGQIRFLIRHLPVGTVLKHFFRTLFSRGNPPFNWLQSLSYTFLTMLLWEYGVTQARDLLDRLEEPLVGNPPRLQLDGRLVSQDLANSALEVQSITSALPSADRLRTVMELGAGYGRTAYAFLKLRPGLRYVVVDIPPALAISERYLTDVFPDRRVFPFRPFASYDEIRAEYEAAEIAFLMPHQVDLLPAKSVDLFVNISSLHEMTRRQIEYYFQRIDRLTGGWFYFKQYKESRTVIDGVIREADYPVRPSWKRVFWRTPRVQSYFFEALLALPSGGGDSPRG
jgi:putative sugar O-methyltransferase